MKDMDKATARLQAAILQKQKIMVYGDYDVDGTTSVAMVYSFLKAQGADAIYHIPDRTIDGYGVSYRSIDFAAQEGVKLIVALDCGIKAAAKVRYAAERGIDYIICDHHLPDSDMPPAAAVLNPQRTDCAYPYKFLSGCGVGFKLLQAYAMNNNIPFSEVMPYLDLVAVSIASDIVPITGENRILAHYGLIVLNTNPRVGLRAIISIAGVAGKNIGIGDIVFKIGPRINAAGRLESGKTSVDLLLAEDEETAKTIGLAVNTYNIHRKNLDHSITDQAAAMVKSDAHWGQRRSIVVYNPQWHKGVVGIVASRLVEQFYRPSVVLTESGGVATGSARSIAGFDLYEAISECAPLLSHFGGHVHAAGLTLPLENVDKFCAAFEAIAQRVLTPEMLTQRVDIDAEINFADITPNFFSVLKQFAPFGPGNISPVFVTRGVCCSSEPRLVGNPASHLKFDLVQQKNKSATMPAIGFGLAEYYDKIKNTTFDVCYFISENTYNGATTLQLNVNDIMVDIRIDK
jgi:single-stranded-DNA-specific exonuclease